MIADAGLPGLLIRELPARGILNLRGQTEQKVFTEAVSSMVALELPGPNASAVNDKLTVLGLAPDEWLLLTAAGDQADLAADLRTAFGSTFAAVTDVSSGYATLEISGAGARELLARGCSIDLHPRVFGTGRCVQTLLAKAGVILMYADDRPVFEVMVRRSLADYLWRWLHDAARDVGFARAGA
ncbi:sarcosine oxidase subunit gamma [Salinisphaera aquimarina]